MSIIAFQHHSTVDSSSLEAWLDICKMYLLLLIAL